MSYTHFYTFVVCKFISISWIVQLSKLYYSFIFVHSGNVGTTMIPRVVSVESVPRPEILSSVKSWFVIVQQISRPEMLISMIERNVIVQRISRP